MIKLALQRIVLAAFTLTLVAVVVFVTTELLPGDVCTAFLGRDAQNQERLERCRDRIGAPARPPLRMRRRCLRRWMWLSAIIVQG
jgi:ABC-type dipeptide/oligopeptide/nickel transport system permease component